MKASPFGWTLHRERSLYVVLGERAFRKDVTPRLLLWCMLVPNQKVESFTIEVGWSKLGRYPELSVRPAPESREEAWGRDEYLLRLGELSHGHDHWWEIEPFRIVTDVDEMMRIMQPIAPHEAQARVAPIVDEAFALLSRHGEPYLADVVRRSA